LSKIRIYQLSKELGVENKDIVALLGKFGVEVKSHASSIEDDVALKVKDALRKKSAPAEKKVTPAKAPLAQLHKKEKPKEAKPKIAKKSEEKKVTPPTKTLIEPEEDTTPAKGEEDSEPVKPKGEFKKWDKQKEKPIDKIIPKVVAPNVVPPKEEAVVEAAPLRKIKLEEAVTVKELAERINVPAVELITTMIGMGIMATVNQSLDRDTAIGVIKNFGCEADTVKAAGDDNVLHVEDNPENLRPRHPIVTIMGHVDHGKTTLLDAIRLSKVTSTEAGGITQAIGAYEVDINNNKVVFLDTPGHEAFTAMRARGAKVTDVVILVVAADDGVMPQTVEALNHAKAAGVPIIVAINKMDKPGANPDRIKQELSKINPDLTPEEWGGKTIYVNVSAKAKTGIDNLLEMVLLQSEILELQANPKCPACGVIIEAKLDKSFGPVATVIIQRGTLRVGDPFVVGNHFGKVRALLNYKVKKISEAGPSIPVEVLGISGVPMAGDILTVMEDERKAKQIALVRSQKGREVHLRRAGGSMALTNLHEQVAEGKVEELNLIIKADSQGSVESLTEALKKIGNKDVRINILHGSAGGVTESDVMLASASNAVIIAFNVEPSDNSVSLADSEEVEIKKYDVIYTVTSEIKLALEGMLKPTEVEKIVGKAEVKEAFHITKVGTIAGSIVKSGVIRRNLEGKLVRDSIIIYRGKISSLKHFKEDVVEVKAGYECGIGFEKFNDIKVGDIIESVEIEQIARKL